MTAAATTWRADARVIGAVSTAHGASHFFQLALPPLFPEIKDSFGVGYTELGLVSGTFFAVSGVGQFAAGFLVDRFGARRILLTGLLLVASATFAAAFAPNYWVLLALAVVGGIGNCVFHPADFAVINARVGPQRLGRAYGAHGIAGNLGWMLAPVLGVALSAAIGWRGALMILGALGIGVALILAWGGDWIDDRINARRRESDQRENASTASVLTSRPIVMCFLYLVLISTALVGLQTFAIPASMAMFDVSHAMAANTLTCFLLGGVVGIMLGAILADRTTQHHVVAASGLLLGALLVALAAARVVDWPLMLPVLMGVAGLAVGATGPSRDWIVKRATPPGATGRVYGFVYCGLDVGSVLSPTMFGWFVDRGTPGAAYAIVVATLILAIFTVLDIRRLTAAPSPALRAAE